MVTITLSAAGAKKAASRLREFLAADGIRLKQTHAYEALAQTLGYANWNTLQASLNAPAPAEKPTEPTDQELRADIARAAATLRQRAGEKGQKAIMLSGNLEQSLHRAIAQAAERRHEHATPEHILLSLCDDPDASAVMQACNVDLDKLRTSITTFFDGERADLVTTSGGDPKPTADFQRVVQRAAIHVTSSGSTEVTGANVLISLFAEHVRHFLQAQGMSRTDAVNYISEGSDAERIRKLQALEERLRRKRRPPQTPGAGVPVEPRPKPKPPLKAEAKLKD